MPRRFRIATRGVVAGPSRWWWVIIHDSLEEMRRCASHWWAAGEPPDAPIWKLTEACTQPIGWWENDDEPGVRHYPATGYAGVIRFVAGQVTAEKVAHEILHAAVAVYRMNCSADACLGEDCGDEEEDLAYIYGELFSSFQDRY